MERTDRSDARTERRSPLDGAPFGADALAILVHDTAHAMNRRHGRSFNEEVERLAGVAAALMYQEADIVCVRWDSRAS